MNTEVLAKTAQAMVANGKGILAIDESGPTCQKNFSAVGVDCTEENRRTYRQLLITAPGIEESISGVILFDETIRQKIDGGTPMAIAIKNRGIIPGIKVDMGMHPLALHGGDKVTEGLDGLRERFAEYKEFGAQFAKWRGTFSVSDTLPSKACIHASSHALARYAALAQEADIVPMVEPEILIDGDHSIERCYDVTKHVLIEVFAQLKEQGVFIGGTILKVSMILPGKDAASQANEETVARETLRCLKENVPAEIPGIVFLSGGQSDEKSTAHLNAAHQLEPNLPWGLSFSYGRALQRPALTMWAQNPKDVAPAQAALTHRARANWLAAQGKYTPKHEENRGY